VRFLLPFALLSLAACATSAVQDDDAGTPIPDTGTTDTGGQDTGVPDASKPDVVTPDAGADTGADVVVPPDAGQDAGAGVAILKLNEVNPNITGSVDLIELRAATAGSTNGITVEQDITSKLVLATLPAITVQAGDLIVVHLTPPVGVVNETSSKTSCANAACYSGAWDVVGTTNGITYSGRVLVVRSPNSVILDGAAFYRAGSASPAGFPAELQALQAANQWLPANCGGPCNTVPLAEGISADWNGVGTVATGASVARKANADTDKAADWLVGTSSFGASNP
jgi:hypothetical protein